MPKDEKIPIENTPKNQSDRETDNSQKQQKPVLYPLLATSVPFSIVIGFLIGHVLDKWLGTGPIFLIAFIIMGVIAGFRQISKYIKKD